MKPWYKSKIILVNAVAAALAALEASTGVLRPALGEGTFYMLIAVGLPVINAVLRTVTTQPLGKPDAPDEHGGLL
jgi:hypothetical protein